MVSEVRRAAGGRRDSVWAASYADGCGEEGGHWLL